MCRRVSLAHLVVLLGALILSHGGAVMSSRRVEVIPGVDDPTIRGFEGRLLQNITEDEKDAELPSCNDVLLHESIDDRCHHALNCEGESLMTFLLPLAFCTDPLESHPLILIFWPIIFFLLLSVFVLLLFRLLGSTAENYFSPALEMLSSEFQIPPPLAGVTLLALGNGAPDVSAVVNAIKINASEGVQLSLGELTGGGMFVQSVVVGRIIFLGSTTAGKKLNGKNVVGVNCGWELIRDISMYGIAAAYVFWMCSLGVIYYRHVVGMLFLYVWYVSGVFAFEIRRYYSNYSLPDIDGDVNGHMDEEGVDELLDNEDTVSALIPKTPFDEEDQTRELSEERCQLPSENESDPQRPDPPGVKAATRVLRVLEKQQQRQRQRLLGKRKSLLFDNSNQHPQDRYSSSQLRRGSAEEQPPWSLKLFIDSLRELCHLFYKVLYDDIWSNSELGTFEWFCMILESPFVIIRKLVTPIPCEEEYNRSLVAASIAFSPVWIFMYLCTKVEDFDPFPSLLLALLLSFAIGCAVLKYAPHHNATAMPLRFSIPLAIYGFVIAASWIDVISDLLVSTLEFIGLILRIPAPIMGMTVLAWGNSVGDYTTNGALAQRGLADMSMAACFAGPSFNLLVGLGCGLLTQKELLLSNEGLEISLMPSVQTGFLFLLSNCAITIFSGIYNKGIIPKMHGYIFWGMYFTYMTMSAQHLTS